MKISQPNYYRNIDTAPVDLIAKNNILISLHHMSQLKSKMVQIKGRTQTRIQVIECLYNKQSRQNKWQAGSTRILKYPSIYLFPFPLHWNFYFEVNYQLEFLSVLKDRPHQYSLTCYRSFKQKLKYVQGKPDVFYS